MIIVGLDRAGCRRLIALRGERRVIAAGRRQPDERQRLVDDGTRRVVVVEQLESVIAGGMIQQRERCVLLDGTSRDRGNLTVHLGPIEAGAHVEHWQVLAEVRNVSGAIVDHRRFDGMRFGILQERPRRRDVA
jgi:hypothetical protein